MTTHEFYDGESSDSDSSVSDDDLDPGKELELICVDAEERIGLNNLDQIPFASHDLEDIYVELLLPREQSSVPWESLPEIPCKGFDLNTQEFSFLNLPPEIWLEVFNVLPGYDALCLALSCRTMYNLSRKRLENMVCLKHLGTWAGKSLVWMGDSTKFETLTPYPRLSAKFNSKMQQRLDKVKLSTLGKFSAEEEMEKIVPFDIVAEFKPLVADIFPREDDFPPYERDAQDYPADEDEAKSIQARRTEFLKPEAERMKSIWDDFDAGKQFLPGPFKRFVQGNFDRDLHMTIFTEEPYVLRNLDKKLWFGLMRCSPKDFLVSLACVDGISDVPHDTYKYGHWVGDRFDVVKQSVVENEPDWEWVPE